MWFLVYQVLLAGSLLVALPIALLARRRHYATSLRARLGLGWPPPDANRCVWIHAVSVGEVGVAATLAPALPHKASLLVTTITPTGQARARALFPQAVVAYLPFDLALLVRRFIARYRPAMLILCEGDLWPAVLRATRTRGIPVAVVNGRVSTASYRRMRRLKPLVGPLFDPVRWFAVQTATDRDRLIGLGVPTEKITVTGNLKFESPEPALDEALGSAISALAAGRPVIVAGSTMPDEEELVLEAFRSVGAGRRALLVLAPRHPERWPDVANLLDRSGLSWRRRSEPRAVSHDPPSVVLLDTLGELAGLYRLAAIAFIGGTLVPSGGHNPLEAARFGIPVVVGPAMDNFQEIERVFDAAGAWQRVESASDLAICWQEWLEEPQRAAAIGGKGAALVDRHRGALAATIAGLEPLLQTGGTRP